MRISEIYKKYQIMPSLQMHMYRVAAVAARICESFTGAPELAPALDTFNIISACLLHDMGNILKFDLTTFPDFLQPEGLEYWTEVQKNFREKYGPSEHMATEKIAKEIGVSDRTFELIQAVGFGQIIDHTKTPDFAKKICEYSDCRVTPFGVVSLEQRLADFKNRYATHYSTPQDEQRRQEFGRLAQELEKQIFAHCSIQPGEITDASLQDLVANLPNFEIK